MYGDTVIEHVDFYGSIHTHCDGCNDSQIELGSAYVAVRPRACVKVGHRTQCEQGFTLHRE